MNLKELEEEEARNTARTAKVDDIFIAVGAGTAFCDQFALGADGAYERKCHHGREPQTEGLGGSRGRKCFAVDPPVACGGPVGSGVSPEAIAQVTISMAKVFSRIQDALRRRGNRGRWG